MELANKVIVITGAGSGIGAAMARRFRTEDPAALVLIDVDLERARDVAAEVDGEAVLADVSNAETMGLVLTEVEDRHGPIDLFCANAGYAHVGSEQSSIDSWERMWGVHVMAHVHAARHLVPMWLARGEGYFLSTASAAGLLTNIGAAEYSVTKHAAVAFAEWLSVTYGDKGIRVSCLCPQFVATPLIEDLDELGDLVKTGVLDPESVAEDVVTGLGEERFLILPHPEVEKYFQNKANDYDRWIAGMRKLARSVSPD